MVVAVVGGGDDDKNYIFAYTGIVSVSFLII